MYYRSDWPEIGLTRPLQDQSPVRSAHADAESAPDWSDEARVHGIDVRWTAWRDRFETELYDIPVWHLRLEMEHVDENGLATSAHSGLDAALTATVRRFLDTATDGRAYVCTNVLETEPVYTALMACGFTVVEERRVYRTPVRDLAERQWPRVDDSIVIKSLADYPDSQHATVREQILDVCFDAFSSSGHSRHFTDPFLSERRPGLAYINAAMALNFERLSPAAFLVAVEQRSNCICGFSVVGSKPGLSATMCTQLLSAARPTFQGRDIYLRITQVLARTLPIDGTLLNVTHASNMPMQMAYQRSGRRHLADTTAVRLIQTA